MDHINNPTKPERMCSHLPSGGENACGHYNATQPKEKHDRESGGEKRTVSTECSCRIDLASCRAGRVTQATPQAAWLPAGLAPARFGADPLCPGRWRKACSAEGGHHLNLGALQGRTSQKAKPSGHTVTVFCPLKQSLPWREKVAQTVPWKRKWRALSRPRGSECRTEVRLEPHPVCPAGPSHHTLSFLPPPPRAGRCE